MDKTAKLFINGGSQAVRLPAEFRFNADQVYVRRDESTGDVVLSSRPARTWAHFVSLRHALGTVLDAETCLAKRPLNAKGTVLRDPFDGEGVLTLYLLDTRIASAVNRQQVNLDTRLGLLPLTDWCISVVTRAELNFGVMRRPDATQLARLVAGFLEVARCLPFDEAAADEFARLRATLEGAGTRIGMADEMIAAHALASGAVVVTDNVRRFERVPKLQGENWVRSG